MNIRTLIPCLAGMLSISACSGGNTPMSAPPVATSAVRHVTGTLAIGFAAARSQSGHARRPQDISAGVKHAALFISGQSAVAGSTTSACTATTGTGTGCTISWSANLAVPASYTFAVEVDSGATGTPANTVLAEGAGTYTIVAGANTLSPNLSLNGAVANASFTVAACTSGACSGNVTLSDASKNAIAYTGTVAVPTIGNSPSSGNVYDNGQVTFASSTASTGTVSGTAQSPFSTFATNTLTIVGVDTTGAYTYQVSCAASSIGTFGITIGGAATPSGVVTTSQLAALTPAVAYPASGVATVGTAPIFSCNAGAISDATGTLGVN